MRRARGGARCAGTPASAAGGDVDRVHARARKSLGAGERDRARAGADVEDAAHAARLATQGAKRAAMSSAMGERGTSTRSSTYSSRPAKNARCVR